jgi:hypothetical protein
MRGNIDKGVCPVWRKEEGGSHILHCEGTRVLGTGGWNESLQVYIQRYKPKNSLK